MEKRIIRLYLLLNGMFHGGISFIGAVYVLFLMSRGLNLFEASLVNATYAIALVAAELPTGLIADTWGRKISFLAACLLMSISMFIYGFSYSLLGFILAEVIGAIGSTCATGAFQAWAIDSLHHHNHIVDLRKLLIREGQIRQICCICGTLAGGYMAGINIVMPWFAGGCAFILTGIIGAVKMREDYFARPEFEFKKHLEKIKEAAKFSFSFGWKTKSVRFVLTLGLINAIAVQAYNMQWQPFFGRHINEKSLFGWIMVGNLVFTLLGYTITNWFARRVKDEEKISLVLSQITIGASIILAASSNLLLTMLIFFFAHETGRGVYGTLAGVYLNKKIPSKNQRATILSLSATGSHIGMIIGLLTSGFLAQYFSIEISWICSSLFLIFASIFAWRNNARKEK